MSVDIPPEAPASTREPAKASAAPLGSSRRARLLLHFSIVVAIFALGAGLLWLAMAQPITTIEGLRGLQNMWAIWSLITQVLFVVGIALLLSRVTRYGPLYPLTLFLVSLEAVQQLVVDAVVQTWPANQPVVDVPFIGMTEERLVFIVIGLYAVGFAIVTVVIRGIGDSPEDTAIQVEAPVGSDRIHTVQQAALRAEDERRRRITAYFSNRPLWPWFASALGVYLLMFAIIGNLDSQNDMFIYWNQLVVPLFGASALALLFGDQKRGPMYYFYLFVVLLSAGSILLDRATGYPFSARSEWVQQIQQLSTREAAGAALISYYYWYWLLMGALVTGYAMAFRFLVYPRWHLATEAEVDACIAADFTDLIVRAFTRLGIDRSRLIAEPVCLRGFPDRSVISNVFFGSWVDKHDRLRFTPQNGTVFAFTADQVLYYEMTVDLTTGVIVNETNAEFFYQDVSNVARISTTQVIRFKALWSILGRLGSLFSRSEAAKRHEMKERSVNDTVQFPGRDVFQINLDSGRAMVVVLRDNSFFDTKRKRIVSVVNVNRPASLSQKGERDADLPIDENERAMRIIRKMLRDNKRGLLLEQR
jgi:hypothetical protein